MGLKPRAGFFSFKFKNRPQSNQRGIETPETLLAAAAPNPGLNRTSVGLKHNLGVFKLDPYIRPQSNQRGIETLYLPIVSLSPDPWPQSNQRGIETSLHADTPPGLQRPQSNQRGIETNTCARNPKDDLQGLNRTSVGLKRVIDSQTHIAHLPASIEPAWD